VGKRAAEIEAHYVKRAKKFDTTIASGNHSNPFLTTSKCFGMNGIDSLVVGHFGDVNKGFKKIFHKIAMPLDIINFR